MKNKLFLAGMFGMVLAFGIVVIGCDNGSTDNEGGSGSGSGSGSGNGNPFVGTWNGTATINSQSAPAVITVTGSTWNFVCQTAGMNESGSYTYSGNSATLKSGNTVIGSATVSGSNLSVVLTGGSYAGGVGTFSNEGGGGSGSGNPFVGTWNGTATFNSQSAPAAITVTGSTWNFVCQTVGMNESGSYTYSGNSATLKSGNTVIGSATVSGSNLSVVLTGGSYAGGVGTFSK